MFFNTTGPVNQAAHYRLDPLHRWDLVAVVRLIEHQKYFLLQAPRQSGKTSCMLALQKKLNAEDEVFCLYVNIESARGAKNDVREALVKIFQQFEIRIQTTLLLDEKHANVWEELRAFLAAPHDDLTLYLANLSLILEKPLVLLVDEIDSLHGDALVAVLSQLRAGFDMRGEGFPVSVMLVGITDVRDYKIYDIGEKQITGGSCFNIKSDSLTLLNFTQEQIRELYLQHTQETGQVFEADAVDFVHECTDGQPWLVNALAYEACFRMEENLDRTRVITKEVFLEAKERLILSRSTHLDQLADKLREDRVRRVLQPMILGGLSEGDEADRQYCLDLGLLKETQRGFVIANRMYKEVLPRELSNRMQRDYLNTLSPDWVNADQSIHAERLIQLFVQFWRENSEMLTRRVQGYTEAAPHLTFFAFLQRVSNGHGVIVREYGFGMKRADLYLRWKSPAGEQRIVFELKLHSEHTSLDVVEKEGVEQTANYADACGADEAHLIVFDRRADVDWAEKVYRKSLKSDSGVGVTVWGT